MTVKEAGEIIKQERLEHNLTQEELAFLAKIDRGRLSKIERGLISRISYMTLERIFNALDMEIVPMTLEEYLAKKKKHKK